MTELHPVAPISIADLDTAMPETGEPICERVFGSAAAETTDERQTPFPVPGTEDEQIETIMGWLDGQPWQVVLNLYDDIHARLLTGTFTPAELSQMLPPHSAKILPFTRNIA